MPRRLYVAVIASNYLIWILGVADALAALGAEYQIARIIAAVSSRSSCSSSRAVIWVRPQ